MKNLIYFARVDSLKDNKVYLKYFNSLPKFRQEQVNKLSINNKYSSVGAFSLLLKLLIDNHIKYNDNDFRIDSNGKPYLKDNPIYFSISHSNDYVVAGISKDPIGVDVELIKERNDINRLATYIFHKDEINKFNINVDKLTYLYRIWCQKESYLKCIGVGLNTAMQTISINNLNDYHFDIFTIDNYQMSVCTKNSEPIDKREISL